MADLVINPGFETEGAAAGLANEWIVSDRSSAIEPAGFRGNTYPNVDGTADYTNALLWACTHASVVVGAEPAPNGTATAGTLTEDALNFEHCIQENGERQFEAGMPYTIGAWIRKPSANGRRYAGVFLALAESSIGVLVDLETGVVVSQYPAMLPFMVTASRDVSVGVGAVEGPNFGWHRVCLHFVAASTFFAQVRVAMSADGTLLAYAGDGASGVHFWSPFAFEGALDSAERFQLGWVDGYMFALDVYHQQAAWYQTSFVQAAAFEDFESGWSNYPYLYALVLAEQATYGAHAFEDFEAGWDNDSFQTTLAPGDVTLAVYHGNTFEDFESGWSNDAFQTTLAPGDLVLAMYNGEDYEGFENTLWDRIFTVNPVTDVFTSGGHGLPNGTQVFALNNTGELAGGLSKTIPYFIIATALNTFQLSLTFGGAAIDATSAGLGEQVVRGDPSMWWNSLDRNETLG